MPVFRRATQIALHIRCSTVARNVQPFRNYSLRPTKSKGFSKPSLISFNSPINSPISASYHIYNFFVKTKWPVFIYLRHMFCSSTIKESLYDKLIIFTRMLHKQSNVYLSLRVRRLGQACHLYHRLYSPNEFKDVFISQFLQKLERCFCFLHNRSSYMRKFLYRNKVLLSFASCGVFSWEENRITDQEFFDLIKEFTSFGKPNTESINSYSDKYEAYNVDPHESSVSQNDGSFMVVNCLQASEKSIENWEEVINQPNLHVWRKSVNNTSLYEYKVFGTFTDITAYSFYSVQRDLEFRKKWDKLVLKLYVVEAEPDYPVSNIVSHVEDSGNELIHWIMRYPYPMRSREYLYLRRSRIDHENKFIILVSRSVPYPKIPETDEHVRVYDYMSQLVIRPHNDNFHDYGFDYMLTYFDDPRASFPSPAYNWMASRGVPDFVQQLHQAALKLCLTKQCELKSDTKTVTTPELGKLCKEDIQDMPTTKPASNAENNPNDRLEKENKNNELNQVNEPTLKNDHNSSQSSFERNRSDSSKRKESIFSFKSINIWN